MRTIEQMIHQEVLCCMSSIVSTLAQGYGALNREQTKAFDHLPEQAFELAAPIPDYEEAARDAIEQYPGRFPDADKASDDYAAFCALHDIEPYDREVFEHWAITNWLADKLENQGEKVDRDFAGLCIWARDNRPDDRR